MRESAAAVAFAATPVDRRHPAVRPRPVRGEAIAEFARLTHDFPPRTIERAGGLPVAIAPSAFAATIITGVIGDILADLVPEDTADRILHVDQVLELRRPLREGDRLTCRTAVESFRHFADYHVLAIRTALVDQRGAVAQSGTTSLLTRVGGGGRAHPRGGRDRPAPVRSGRGEAESARDRLEFGAMAIGDELAPWSVTLSRAELLRYAELTGATGAAPSTVEIALATAYLARRFGPRAAPTRVRTQSSRHIHHLTVPVAESARVEFRGRVTGFDSGRGRVTVALTAHSGERALFSHASVDLQLPRAD